MTSQPTPHELDHMIEAIFVKCDLLLAANELDPPGNLTGFTELLRLTFDKDEQGRAIFASMDEELLTTLYGLYEDRRRKKQSQEQEHGTSS
ncbi:MAG: hypothetical protein ACON49_09135 [Candidatus Puniceispirillaceae bacterium]